MTPADRRRLFVLVAAVLWTALTARLGFWQLDRAAQKTAAQVAMDERRSLPPLLPSALAAQNDEAAQQHQRRITLQGRWLPEFSVYLENRQMDGKPGFFSLAPLLLADGTAVLVQRGWMPRDLMDRTRITAPPPPDAVVTVQGRIAPPPGRIHDFDGAASGPIRQNVDLVSFASETRLRLRPLSIVQEEPDPPLNDGLLRRWPAPALDVHKHHGYAFQWFALCGLTIALYAWFQIISPRRQRARERA